MSIANIVLLLYVITVVITMSFCIRICTEVLEEEGNIINPRIIGIAIGLVPIINLYVGFKGFLRWLAFKLIQYKLNKIRKRHVNDPEIDKGLKEIIDDVKKNK